jgi:hypothetical protein
MWRSFFLAIGAYCCLLGIEALAIERAVLKVNASNAQTSWREVIPPDWAPWSLLGAGAVVMLYSFTIPQRVNGANRIHSRPILGRSESELFRAVAKPDLAADPGQDGRGISYLDLTPFCRGRSLLELGLPNAYHR